MHQYKHIYIFTVPKLIHAVTNLFRYHWLRNAAQQVLLFFYSIS